MRTHYTRVVVAYLLAFLNVMQRYHIPSLLKPSVWLAGVVKEVRQLVEFNKSVFNDLKWVVSANVARVYCGFDGFGRHNTAAHQDYERPFFNRLIRKNTVAGVCLAYA